MKKAPFFRCCSPPWFVPFQLIICLFITCLFYTARCDAAGDLDLDGRLTAVDAAIVFQIVDGKIRPDDVQAQNADADEDGRITVNDAELILHWAANELPPGRPLPAVAMAEFQPVETTAGLMDSKGGSVALSSGAKVTIPAAVLSQSRQITISQLDPTPVDNLGNKICFQFTPDVSYFPGTTILVPYKMVLRPGESIDDLEGAALGYLSPQTRAFDLRQVEWQDQGAGLLIDLSQVRSIQGVDMADNADLFLCIVLDPSVRSVDPAEIASYQPNAAVPDWVPYFEQGETGYCWACCTVMVANYLRVPHSTGLGIRPWNAAEYLGIYEGAKGFMTWFIWAPFTELHRSYIGYLHSITGYWPEVSFFIKANSLQTYVKKELDRGHPIMMGLSDFGHQIVAVGYHQNAAGNITSIIAHNPAEQMYQIFAWDTIARTSPASTVHTRVIKAEPGYRRGISINISSRLELTDDHQGQTFKSPMNYGPAHKATFYDGDIRFSWCPKEIRRHGHVGHGGKGTPVAAIPNYYAMDLKARVANADPVYANTRNVRIAWSMTPLSTDAGEADGFEGERSQEISSGITVYEFNRNDFTGLDGEYLFHVTASDGTGDLVHDALDIRMSFDQGVPLNAARGPNSSAPEQQVVNLTWGTYGHEFDQYQIYRKIGSATQWTLLGTAEKTTTAFMDSDPQALLADVVHYGIVVQKDQKVLVTSNVATLKKESGHLIYQFHDPAAADGVSGIGVIYLPTREQWQWKDEGGADLQLIGVNDSGRILCVVPEGHDSLYDRLVFRDDWAADELSEVDITGPCLSFDIYYQGANLTAGMTATGRILFHGYQNIYEPIFPEFPEYGGSWVMHNRFFASIGNGCEMLDIDLDGDDEPDDLNDLGIEGMTVALESGDILFETETWSLGLVNGQDSGFRWLSDECIGPVKISVDGSRCLFNWDGPNRQAATIPSSGGVMTKLGDATGLIISADASAISPDGSVVCALAAAIDTGKSGLIRVQSDGSSWNWLNSGLVQPIEAPRFTQDGQKIVFTGITETDAPTPDSDIYIMPLDNSDLPRNLTNTKEVFEAHPYLF